MAIILAILGIILCFSVWWATNEFGFLQFLSTFLPYGIIAAIVAGLGEVFAVMLEVFSDIHYYLRIAVESEESGASGNNESQRTAGEGEWKCHACGRVHKMYTTSCPCGQRRDDN